jgi:hypothetical protein
MATSTEDIKKYVPPDSGESEDVRNRAIMNEFLDSITQEALAAVQPIRQQWIGNVDYGRGKQWPDNIPGHRVPFTANMIGPTCKRKASYLTDTKPLIDVIPYSDKKLTETGELLTSLARAWWDERSINDALTHGLYTAQIFGSCPFNLIYNRDLDLGRGDVDLRPWDPRHFLIDPGVVRSHEIAESAFMIFEEMRPLELLRYQYPQHATKLKADPVISKYSTFNPNSESGMVSALKRQMRQTFKLSRSASANSLIPKLVVQEYWVRDYRRFGDLSSDERDRINMQYAKDGWLPKKMEDLAFEGGRHIIRAGDVILVDEENPYWDRTMPGELLSWGMEIEHPWGQSEVTDLKKLQDVINKLGGSMVENSLHMNNLIWIGDANALTPLQWDKLSDKPGLIVKKRPGSELRREAPPPLPGSTFGLMQFLIEMVAEVTGMNDAAKGQGTATSGVLQDSMQAAANTMIRLQARQMEGFLNRMGHKLIARFFQFYTNDRIMSMVGQDGRIVPFNFHRDKLIALYKRTDLRDAFRDFRFQIKPMSSLSITKQQEIIAASNLMSMGLLPGSEVLKVAGYLNAEDLVKQARFEQAQQMAPQGSGIKQGPAPVSPPLAGPGV